jgi:hypothetical protein
MAALGGGLGAFGGGFPNQQGGFAPSNPVNYWQYGSTTGVKPTVGTVTIYNVFGQTSPNYSPFGQTSPLDQGKLEAGKALAISEAMKVDVKSLDTQIKEERDRVMMLGLWNKEYQYGAFNASTDPGSAQDHNNRLLARLIETDRTLAALQSAELKVKKLEEKIPQIDLLAYDRPRGRITRIDINNQTAYINIGSADNVRPGLTFSVFGLGQYRPNAERKGSLEVVNVLGDHLSAARITSVKSATRDPLVVGDELYNPAWSPGLREHVAVAGPIDVTGDGRDGTLEFVKILEKQGVAVDVFLDPRDLSLKGRGLTRQTGYLLLGDHRAERNFALNTRADQMREEAHRLGITIVPARRFMSLMGYRQLPALSADLHASAQSELLYKPPSFQFDQRYFLDLLAHAPAMKRRTPPPSAAPSIPLPPG